MISKRKSIKGDPVPRELVFPGPLSWVHCVCLPYSLPWRQAQARLIPGLLLAFMFPTFPPEKQACPPQLQSNAIETLMGPIYVPCPVLWSGKEGEDRVLGVIIFTANICKEEKELVFILPHNVCCLDLQTRKKWAIGQTDTTRVRNTGISSATRLGVKVYIFLYVLYIKGISDGSAVKNLPAK